MSSPRFNGPLGRIAIENKTKTNKNELLQTARRSMPADSDKYTARISTPVVFIFDHLSNINAKENQINTAGVLVNTVVFAV